MKKLLFSSAMVLALGLSLTSCRDTDKKEDSVIIIEKEVDKAPEKADGALEKAGRAIDNAAKEVKEAGKAVDSAAKEVVGDDN
ncbi:hypothetical protein [Gelidibacter sp.]|uniref:hypothetical protein n=1 Tax=Gelidibacter sp. TaxID=2018083 RepID=UPI002BA6961F|nr:hypothetical protein [Gelidibacter sp.]HUH26864.1 hypothetical protein [Gelidibacter sp.]